MAPRPHLGGKSALMASFSRLSRKEAKAGWCDMRSASVLEPEVAACSSSAYCGASSCGRKVEGAQGAGANVVKARCGKDVHIQVVQGCVGFWRKALKSLCRQDPAPPVWATQPSRLCSMASCHTDSYPLPSQPSKLHGRSPPLVCARRNGTSALAP